MKALLLVVAMVGVFFAFLYLHSPVSQSEAKGLRLGMGTNEAQALLGKPASVLTDTRGFQLWEYHRFSLRTFMLHFDASGHLVSFETD